MLVIRYKDKSAYWMYYRKHMQGALTLQKLKQFKT